jgi:phosphatidyl-myo-inositol alpha-mannosyltransferase
MSKILTIGLLLDDTLDRADGVQQAVLTIGAELSKRGHLVHYIVPETKRNDLPNIHSVGKFINLKFNGNSVRTPLPASTTKINELFNNISFDVLHVQMPYSPFLSAKVLKRASNNVRKVGTFHILPYNKLSLYGTKFLGIVMQKSINSIHTAFTVSKPANKFMQKSFGIKGIVVPNPVDYSFFSSFKKSNKQKKQIVFVGRFEQRKGVLELINAYAMLDTTVRKQTELIMCGMGPLLEEAKKLNRELGLSITFPGFVSDSEKAQNLANADIAVFPSISGESFGIVLAEAMSAGAGVTIGGDNPGYKSVLGDWPDTLFKPTDIEKFSSKLSYFIQNDKERYEIGVSQHSNVKKYDTKHVVDTLLKYYQKS